MSKNIKICCLGSGSKGNSFIISGENEAIMIDAGFSRKELFSRIERSKFDLTKLKAVLLTHEHDDHVKGCRLFCDDLKIPLFLTSRTAFFLDGMKKLPKKVVEFEPGDHFNIGNFDVSAFAVQHDAIDPVGFIIKEAGCKVGVATDLGELNKLCRTHLAGCSALLLESNYDKEMLYNSLRPLELKRRINGRMGHLDNLDALAALSELLDDATKFLMLVHVSQDCNHYDLVEKINKDYLKKINREYIFTHVALQNEISEWFEII